jgi:hypothetical protein
VSKEAVEYFTIKDVLHHGSDLIFILSDLQAFVSKSTPRESIAKFTEMTKHLKTFNGLPYVMKEPSSSISCGYHLTRFVELIQAFIAETDDMRVRLQGLLMTKMREDMDVL